MILVDSSVWVDHLRSGNEQLASLLDSDRVLTHPFVTGEIALGTLRHRTTVLGALMNLPKAVVAQNDEVLAFIADKTLFGRGIGYVDAHLLASTRLTSGTRLWTLDKRLGNLAAEMNLAAVPG